MPPKSVFLRLVVEEQPELDDLAVSIRMRSTLVCLSLMPLASPANSMVMATQSPLAMLWSAWVIAKGTEEDRRKIQLKDSFVSGDVNSLMD